MSSILGRSDERAQLICNDIAYWENMPQKERSRYEGSWIGIGSKNIVSGFSSEEVEENAKIQNIKLSMVRYVEEPDVLELL